MPAASDARAPALRAGVGRADITPPTGYAIDGLGARRRRRPRAAHAAVRPRDRPPARRPKKIALVAADLFMVSGGLVAGGGATGSPSAASPRRNILRLGLAHPRGAGAASPTSPRYNTLAPSPGRSPSRDLLRPAPRADRPQLYTFLVSRLALAIRRADDDLGPGRGRLGQSSSCSGVTTNRSLEAHLADHGIVLAPGAGQRRRRTRAATRTRSTPRSTCCASTSSVRRRPRSPDRRVVDVRRPRHGQPSRVPASTTPTTTARRRASSRRRCAALGRVPGATRTWSTLRQHRRGRPVGRPRPAAGRRPPSRSAASRRARCCAPGARPARA